MNKRKFFLLPICLLLLGACNVNTPASESKKSEQVSEPDSSSKEETSASSEEHVHQYGEWQVAVLPTCTEKGVEKRFCECGAFESRDTNALGHQWDEGVMTTRPTGDAAGVMTYTCQRKGCGQTKTEAIPKVDGYTVNFTLGEHCKLYIFRTQQYETETPTEATTCKARDENGEIVEYDPADKLLQPQVSFKVVCDDGYTFNGGLAEGGEAKAKDIDYITGTYNKIKNIGNGIFRITKVQTNLAVTITPVVDSGEVILGNKVEFVTAHCSVKVYVGPKDRDGGAVLDEGPDYYTRGKNAPYGYTASSGQLNFEVVPETGYKFVDEIDPEATKQEKDAPLSYICCEDYNKIVKEAENVYRVTGISKDIAIKLRCIPEAGEPTTGHVVTFVTSHCKVLVYDTQDTRFAPQELVDNKTLARLKEGDIATYVAEDKTNGIAEVAPQVNFLVVCDEGYEFNSGVTFDDKGEAKAKDVSIITGNYNKFKNVGNGVYRITKVQGDLTVTITATAAVE